MKKLLTAIFVFLAGLSMHAEDFVYITKSGTSRPAEHSAALASGVIVCDGSDLLLSNTIPGAVLSGTTTVTTGTNSHLLSSGSDGVYIDGVLVGGGGSQTPWISNVDAAGFSLSNVGGLVVSGTASFYSGDVSINWNSTDGANINLNSNVTNAQPFVMTNTIAGQSLFTWRGNASGSGIYYWLMGAGEPDGATNDWFLYDNVGGNYVLHLYGGAVPSITIGAVASFPSGIKTQEGDVFYPHTSGADLIWTNSP